MAALCLAATPLTAAAGGGLAVSPVTIEFARTGGARAIEISNPGDETIHVQVRLFDWSVDLLGDHYLPTGDVGFSPPMFELAPGATQVVRLAPMSSPSAVERAYRLFVDQLPDDRATPGQLKMPVRMIVPVFVPPLQPSAPAPATQLQWRLKFNERSGQATLIAANSGRRRIKMVDLAYGKDGEAHDIRSGLAGYVLASQERGWTFPVAGLLTALDVTVTTDAGPLKVRVPFAAN